MFKKLKNSKILSLLIALMLVLTLAVGCSQSAQPAAQQEPPASQEPAQSAEAESVTSEEAKAEPVILEWSDWQAKMTGTINKDYFVLDLRTPDEIKMEKGLEGSINIDANETLAKGDVAIIEEKLATVPKDAVLLIHCKSGGRAKANAAKFIEAGFTNVFVLDGWTAFDNKGYFGASKIDSNTTHLKPEAWQGKMEGTIGSDYFVFDVRDKAEYDAGHIQGALNFGVRDQFTIDHEATMAKIADAVPNEDALILVHCAVGKRAKVAHAHLSAEGYSNVFILDNNIQIDQDGNVKFE